MTPALLIAAAAISAASTFAGSDSIPVPTSLAEVVALAQQNALSVVQAAGDERATASAVRSAYAAFLPSVSVSAGGSRQLPSTGARTTIDNGQVVTLAEQPWSFNMGLGANVTLFDGGQRFFDLRQAQARAVAAGADAISQRFAATLSAKQEYFNVLAARESATAAKAQLDQAEQQLRTAVARVRARIATRSDSLRAEIQVRNARLAVTDARNSIDTANASLTRAAGTSYPITAAPDSTERTEIIQTNEDLLKLAESGPAVRQARRLLDAARSARRSSWTGYLPSLSAAYSRSGNGTTSGFSPVNDDYAFAGSLRLSLSFPLFNQLQREEQVVRAKVAEEGASASLRDAQLAARESLIKYLGAYRSAQEHVDMQIATVSAAEEDLRVQQERYGIGASTILDVLTSQTELDTARRDLIRSRYDLRVARAQIESLIGSDL
jgi:outer membrane protein